MAGSCDVVNNSVGESPVSLKLPDALGVGRREILDVCDGVGRSEKELVMGGDMLGERDQVSVMVSVRTNVFVGVGIGVTLVRVTVIVIVGVSVHVNDGVMTCRVDVSERLSVKLLVRLVRWLNTLRPLPNRVCQLRKSFRAKAYIRKVRWGVSAAVRQ